MRLKLNQHFTDVMAPVQFNPEELKVLHDHIAFLARRADEEAEKNNIWWRDKMRLIAALGGIFLAISIGQELAEAALKFF